MTVFLLFNCCFFMASRPLELDTDGIWCILPSSFPENFEVKQNVNDDIIIHCVVFSFIQLILRSQK